MCVYVYIYIYIYILIVARAGLVAELACKCSKECAAPDFDDSNFV